jgi:hypothetical protein
MISKFNNPLEVSADGRRITATGPLEWQPGDAPHCRITVVLTQGTVSAPGDTGNYDDEDKTWECHVDAPHGARWQVGLLVHCVGTITMSAPPPAASWPPQDVSLQVQQAAAPA